MKDVEDSIASPASTIKSSAASTEVAAKDAIAAIEAATANFESSMAKSIEKLRLGTILDRIWWTGILAGLIAVLTMGTFPF